MFRLARVTSQSTTIISHNLHGIVKYRLGQLMTNSLRFQANAQSGSVSYKRYQSSIDHIEWQSYPI